MRDKAVIQAANDALSSLIHDGGEMARPLQRAVRNTMWEYCGVVRNQERLEAGLQRLQELKEAAERVDVRPSSEGWQDLATALDLQGALYAAELTYKGHFTLPRRPFAARWNAGRAAVPINATITLRSTLRRWSTTPSA